MNPTRAKELERRIERQRQTIEELRREMVQMIEMLEAQRLMLEECEAARDRTNGA